MEINEDLLVLLIKDSYKLSCLEAYGVDNWGGYSEALCYDADGELSYFDFIKQDKSEILKYCSNGN